MMQFMAAYGLAEDIKSPQKKGSLQEKVQEVEIAQDPLTGQLVQSVTELRPDDRKEALFRGVPSSKAFSSETIVAGGNLIRMSARQCVCGPLKSDDENKVYCQSKFTHCSIDVLASAGGSVSGIAYEPKCIVISQAQRFARTTFPFILMWYCVLISCLICRPGRNALHYSASFCFPSWTSEMAGQILIRQPERARQILIDGQGLIPMYLEAIKNQNSFILRTKLYRNKSMQDPRIVLGVKTDDEKDICSICLVNICDGDRIGSLPCDHLFHTTCLKTWLARQQRCPLCQRGDFLEKFFVMSQANS